jgi:threonine dehydrogenase-like Zn-dependent dehydrogenase
MDLQATGETPVRAIRYRNGHVWLDEASAAPAPEEGEAVVRVVRAGVSRADLAICRGEIEFDGVLGHELAGVVEGFGEGVDGATRKRWQGRRVTASPDIACATCDMCRAGLSTHCRRRQAIGLIGRDGCLAERVSMPVRNLWALPDRVDDDAGVFSAATAGALHAAQVVRIEGKAYITVLGDDVTALLCAQVMQRLNASVRVLGRHRAALDMCEKWGIRHRHVDEAGRRQDQDVVVVCDVTGRDVAIASGMLRARGKILLLGHGAPAKAEVDAAPIIESEIEVIGVRGGSIGEGAAAIERGTIDVNGLVTRRFKLGEGVAAIRAAAEEGQLKVVVEGE